MKYLILFIMTFMLSCNKENSAEILGYPSGFQVIDLKAENDCNLPACSDLRIERLRAEDVRATIVKDNLGEYFVTYGVSFDSSILLYFCNLPEQFKQDNLQVVFSGSLLDTCGVHEANGPIEQIFLIKLLKIERQ